MHAGRGSAILTRLAGASAVTLGRHVCLSPAAAEACGQRTAGALETLAHEFVHVRQYARQGFVPFLVRYLRDYLRGRRRGLSHHEAYLAIDAEFECAAAARRFAALLGEDPGICRALGSGQEIGALQAQRFTRCLAGRLEPA